MNFIPHCEEQQAAWTALGVARSSYTTEQCADRHLTQRGGGRWGGVSTFLFVNRLTTCPDLRGRVLFNKLPVCASYRLPCAYRTHFKAAVLAATSFCLKEGVGGWGWGGITIASHATIAPPLLSSAVANMKHFADDCPYDSAAFCCKTSLSLTALRVEVM